MSTLMLPLDRFFEEWCSSPDNLRFSSKERWGYDSHEYPIMEGIDVRIELRLPEKGEWVIIYQGVIG